MKLSEPLNWKAKVLYTLIKKGNTDLKDFPFLAGFRTRISEFRLQHNVKLISVDIPDLGFFGRRSDYKRHYLPPEEVNNAIQVYNLINKAKN